jgi:oligopeptidase B
MHTVARRARILVASLLAVPALLAAACSAPVISASGPAPAKPAPAAPLPAPPVARQEAHPVVAPFGTRNDEYYWVRDDDPSNKRDDVMDAVKAEAAYADAFMARLKPLEDTLVREMRSRIKEDDSTVPAYDRGYWYWQRFDAGAEYPTYVRQQGSPAGADPNAAVEVLLDVPAMAKGKDFMKIGGVSVSPDGRWLAWTEDLSGRRIHTIHIKELATGRELPDRIGGTLETVQWAADGATLFYIKQDPVLLQSGPVFRHARGTPEASDSKVYDEPDKTLFTEISESRSRKYLLIHMEGYDTNELRAVPLEHPEQPPVVVMPRRANVRNYADHCAGRWLVRSNDGARNFKLCVAPEAKPADPAGWTTILAHRTDAAIDDALAFDGGIAVLERVEANARIRILPWAGGSGFSVPTDETAFSMSLGDNRDATLPFVRIGYTSMVVPRTVLDVNLESGSRTIRKVQPVIGYDRTLYATLRTWAPSRDGKRIPVSLSWRRDAWKRDGTHPVRIEGYGAYGIPTDAEFDSSAISLMDRGFLIALAHVRGGGDLGQDWYEDGRLMHKRNTFNDFVDATDFLGREGFASPALRFATGGSAGGLLMGAIANQAGDRYRGIALHVPFVDALTTMLDETIPLTPNEWTQWGNPKESKEAYEYIRSYSPYDNLEAKPYPAMLVTTGLWDSQVQYFEPLKYVSRLRRLRTDRNPFILHVNMEAGHGGKSGRFERLEEAAMEQAFFLDLAGISR